MAGDDGRLDLVDIRASWKRQGFLRRLRGLFSPRAFRRALEISSPVIRLTQEACWERATGWRAIKILCLNECLCKRKSRVSVDGHGEHMDGMILDDWVKILVN